jgi:hypothetical protein
MRTDTLSGAYTVKLGRLAQPAPRQLPVPLARPAPVPLARPVPAPLADADVLLIAVRRSLESCKDSSQLRMFAAFESPRRSGL